MKNYNRFVLYSMQPTVITGNKTLTGSLFRRVAMLIVRFFNRSG